MLLTLIIWQYIRKKCLYSVAMQLLMDTMCALVASITNENLNDDSSTIKIVNPTFVRKIVRLLVVKNNIWNMFFKSSWESYFQKITIYSIVIKSLLFIKHTFFLKSSMNSCFYGSRELGSQSLIWSGWWRICSPSSLENIRFDPWYSTW